MKELFQSRQKEDDEETQAQAYYKKFSNQGPAYFGDLDEQDGSLLEYERKMEEEGASRLFCHSVSLPLCLVTSPSFLFPIIVRYRT